MSLATPDTDTALDLLKDLAPPCGHAAHDRDLAHHSGPATWIMYYPGTECGCPFEGHLRCDTWTRYVLDSDPRPQLVCRHGRTMTDDEMQQVYAEPIDPSKD